MILGLTGPTGSGKTTFSAVALEMGFAVIDCDKEARLATVKGSEGLRKLCAVFGEDILLPDDSLNRKKLAALAFATKENTERLNKTLLPIILEQIRVKIAEFKAAGFKDILLDAPTLFESGADKLCDKTVAVLCDRETRKKRIMLRDGLTESEAETRLSAAQSDEFFSARADSAFYCNDRKDIFEADCRTVLKKLKNDKY